ncbi:hypothetical protein L873DRAFT_1727050 [Choiromyces venosus 120613-1]|uniref:Uncharacterized protein n=1 Tax=Choiromyces venosus 120613-1 TaxID=1336337 RepID=A0A3N4KCB2_9PEZI|nr:hypothetical protein L873DRAFT_1727050 [Choiromyces venosus 120613-1]
MSSLASSIKKELINFTIPFIRSFILLTPLLALGAVVVYVYEQTNKRRIQAAASEKSPTVEEPLLAEAEPQPTPLADGEAEDHDDDDDDDDDDGVEEEFPQDAETEELMRQWQAQNPDFAIPPELQDDGIPGGNEGGLPQIGAGGMGAAGPAGGQTRPHIPRTRNVGAKKARSLARRDQRRAYHEFLHSQAAMRASAAAAIAEEEQDRMFEEKRRRALIEDEIAERKEAERKARAEAERKGAEKERGDVEGLKKKVAVPGAWRVSVLGGKRGEEWSVEVLRREGLVGKVRGGEDVGIITGEGWYVRLGERQLELISGEIEKKGRMEWREIADRLEWVVGK